MFVTLHGILPLKNIGGKEDDNGLTKVTFGGAGVTIGRTFEIVFNLTTS